MLKIFQFKYYFIGLVLFFLSFSVCFGQLQDTIKQEYGNMANYSGYPVASPEDLDKINLYSMAGKVINTALGVIGIVLIIIILYAGYKWMSSGGATDKAAEARKMIFAAVIGIVIILSAYAISNFVLNQLLEAQGIQATEEATQ